MNSKLLLSHGALAAAVVGLAAGCSSFKAAFNADAKKDEAKAKAAAKEAKDNPDPLDPDLNEYERGFVDQSDRDYEKERAARKRAVFSF
jgi:hypothetical protein